MKGTLSKIMCVLPPKARVNMRAFNSQMNGFSSHMHVVSPNEESATWVLSKMRVRNPHMKVDNFHIECAPFQYDCESVTFPSGCVLFPYESDPFPGDQVNVFSHIKAQPS